MYRKFLKRFFDIVFSLALTPIVLAVIVLCAPFIFICDPGNIFYLAKRRGRNGRDFLMLKLRTMYKNSPEIRNADGSVYSGKRDARITPVGRVLRRLSLDELPQVFNVLLGNMSFIGPRPHLATVDYVDLDEARKKRLTVRPGITGYSQAYFRNSVGMEEKILNDCFYADNVSFWLDVKILLRTIFSVFTARNVYSDSVGDGCSKK